MLKAANHSGEGKEVENNELFHMFYEDGQIGCEKISDGDYPDIRAINVISAVPRDEWLYSLFSGNLI